MAKKEEFIPNGSVIVDGIEIKTHKRSITSCNIIEVEVGTTKAVPAPKYESI